jgi:ferredoxin
MLLADLLSMKLTGFSGAAWGYNFPWQSRNFFAPLGTPTIVPTAFAARALLEANQVLDAPEYLNEARSVCDFILQDLPRTHETDSTVCFSYTPQTRTDIYNASLLAAEILASVGKVTREPELCQFALRAARYVANQQHENGSWAYGAEPSQSWVDSFHTAFVLTSLQRIVSSCDATDDSYLRGAINRGYSFWRRRFFLADGWPKYYDDSPYPADAHAAASAIVALCELSALYPNALELAEAVANWSIRYLRDDRGFFYYQRRRFFTVRTPFMRWAQAWVLYALARLEEERVRRASVEQEKAVLSQANHPPNVPGKYYVDWDVCLDHECCVEAAPNNFLIGDSLSAYVFKQPMSEQEEAQCRTALDDCPVGAIKDDG